MAKKAKKTRKAKSKVPGESLRDDPAFQALLQGLIDNPTDFPRCGIVADYCEDNGELELSLALKWMQEWHKAPAKRILYDNTIAFVWSAHAPGKDFHNVWCLFRNRNHWFFPTYLVSLQFLAKHLMKMRRQFTVPGDILHGK